MQEVRYKVLHLRTYPGRLVYIERADKVGGVREGPGEEGRGDADSRSCGCVRPRVIGCGGEDC